MEIFSPLFLTLTLATLVGLSEGRRLTKFFPVENEKDEVLDGHDTAKMDGHHGHPPIKGRTFVLDFLWDGHTFRAFLFSQALRQWR